MCPTKGGDRGLSLPGVTWSWSPWDTRHFPLTDGIGHSLPALRLPLVLCPFIRENTGYFMVQCFPTAEQSLCRASIFLDM